MRRIIAVLLFFLVCCRGVSFAETIDRVVAYVDDEAITLRELNAAYEAALQLNPGTTREKVLDSMIDRFLLLREARLLRLEAPDEEELLNEYVELKVKAFIKISEQDLKAYYQRNRKDFGELDFDAARDGIEALLQKREVSKMLEGHIQTLRSRYDIKILDR